MSSFIYRNIALLLLVSIFYGATPVSDAGLDISETVTSCVDKDVIISVDGSASSLSGVGVCDIGVCSNDARFCTTSLGPTDETCQETSDCGDDKLCVGGNNDGSSCVDDSGCGLGTCEFLRLCLSEYLNEAHCEGDWNGDGDPDGIWFANYQYIDESACDALEGDSNNKWYDYSLDYNWFSNSDNLEMVSSTNVMSDVRFGPFSDSNSRMDTVYLVVNNTFSDTTFSDTSHLTITLDPELPCAVSGEDIYLCRACSDPNSAIYNVDYIDSVLSTIQLDASGSYSNGDASNFSYSWTVPDGFVLSDNSSVTPQLLIADNNYAAIRKSVHLFTLAVTDNASSLTSILDTMVIYMNPSKPESPKVEVYAENDKVTLNWARNASMFSVDSLSGYSDFEGYRIYRSLDGGSTWGSADDRIFYNGEAVGWRHKEQTDMSEFQDSNFCIKGLNGNVIGDGLDFNTWGDCISYESSETNPDYTNCCNGGLVRGFSISNLDPSAPWINLGDDSGLEFSYVDTNVYNGKEYTYAVVAYDTGLRSYVDEVSETGVGICVKCDGSNDNTLTEEECCELNSGIWGSDDICSDDDTDPNNIIELCGSYSWEATYQYNQAWPSTNPDQFTYDGLYGFQSLESEFIESINVVTAIPAFYAENVENISNFKDAEDFGIPAEGKFMDRSLYTVGNGGIFFQIINPYDISDNKYKFEINADYAGSDVEIFEGYKTEFPKLYAWQVADSLVNGDTVYTAVFEEEAKISDLGLTPSEICEFMNLPGAYIDGVCSRSTKVCDGGSRDGKECTYDEDYCTGGECVVTYEIIAYNDDGSPFDSTAINYLDNYYACMCDDVLADLSGADGPASDYNLWITNPDIDGAQDLNTIRFPMYEVEDFSIKYLYEDGYNENYTEFLDGLKFIFNNNVQNISDLDDGSVQVETLQSFNADSVETNLADYIDIRLEYGSGGSVFDNKPSYSYRIEFSDSAKYEASVVTPSGGCSGDRPNTLLPFQVINTTTGKIVGVNHVDKGGFYDEAGEYNAYGTCIEDGNPCSASEYCNVNECLELKGYGDCAWEKNERTSFTQDTVHVGLTTRETPEYTFDLKINYRVFSLYSKGIDPSQIEAWVSGQTYETEDIVKYNDMFWKASSPPDVSTNPAAWVNGSGSYNSNPWRPVYPWDDGDYIIIEPTRWYVDGDNWIADLSKLGQSKDISQKDLEKISVVPNPYIVYSDYDETPASRRLWFNHLPNKCRITIYTISGERVASMLHDDDALSGKESWDLRSQSGDLVAPGLYLYTVESEDASGGYINHVSKFAIVR